MIKLKNILSEGYAWERESGKPMPTLKTVAEKYEKNLKEQEEMQSANAEKIMHKAEHVAHRKLQGLNDVEREALAYELEQLGITAETTPEEVMDIVKSKLGESVNEDAGANIANIVHGIGGALMKSMLVPLIPLIVGDVTGTGFGGGMAITAAAAGILIAAGKALGAEDDQAQIDKLMRNDESVNESFDTHRMSALIELYHQYKDGGITKEVFHNILKLLNRNEREELLGYIKTRHYGDHEEMMAVTETYDAKGVEEASKPDFLDLDKDGNKKELMKKAAEDAKEVNKEEDICDSCGKPKDECECERHDHSEATDESVLNMGSLEESFWGRVRGNLHGHEYILREEFRK